ncbi:MAG: 5'/3'-nucleotidase SurE [Bacteroidales bacterium]|nr:5'/3'-nucleotidase SurE [Bacteroidales bacterium]
MKILLVNDDGYKAGGLRALADVMSAFGDITVVAPKFHQSAMSMAVSLGRRKLVFKPLPELGPGKWNYLDATPASCVKFGLEYFYEHRNPDLVVSGINHGSNAATAANYSATMGAAEEAALNGVRSIGVSLCNFSEHADFTMVKKYLPGIIRFLLDNWPQGKFGLFYNVNFPDVTEPKGIRITRQGLAHWEKEFQEWDKASLDAYASSGFGLPDSDTHVEPGETAYMMIGDFYDDEPGNLDADHVANDAGWITITPCTMDSTDYQEYNRLKSIDKSI